MKDQDQQVEEKKTRTQVTTSCMVSITKKLGDPICLLTPVVLFTCPPALLYSFPHSLQFLGLSCQPGGCLHAPRADAHAKGPSLPACELISDTAGGGESAAGVHSFLLNCCVLGLV